MQYTTFGDTGLSVSRLGFGAMRLPMTGEGDTAVVDYDKAVPVIHRAFELGVNYIDTAYGYCKGTSEIAVGRALKGWRDKVYLSTKCPMGQVEQRSDYRRLLEEQLKKLDTDVIDFYHFHGLRKSRFHDQVIKFNLLEEAAKAKAEGLIRYCSFSFHDEPDVMNEIVDTNGFDSLLCQYNLLDRSNEEAMAYAAQKGVGIVVMGPVGGGRFSQPSEVIQRMAPGARSTPEVALRFVLANPDVSIALSGMSTIAMVEENAATASRTEALDAEEQQALAETLERTRKLADLYCTGCEYCLPCPNGVNIPMNFQALIYKQVYGLPDGGQALYNRIQGRRGEKASSCIACGECEPKCPQNIPIIEQLAVVRDTFEQ